jgi:hypothetical protein
MQNICIECGNTFGARSAKNTICSTACVKARRKRLQREARERKQILAQGIEQDFLSPIEVEKRKLKVTKSQEHEAAVDAFIPKAEKYANKIIKNFQDRIDREKKDIWCLEYLNKMNDLTIKAGLRIAF